MRPSRPTGLSYEDIRDLPKFVFDGQAFCDTGIGGNRSWSRMMDKIQALSRSAIFEDIGREAVEELCSRGREVAFEEGHRLFERERDAKDLMIVQEGMVDLVFPIQVLNVTREVTMESVRAVDVVAWSSLVPPHRFTLSARCASPCVFTALSRDDLHAFFEIEPQTGYLFMRNLAELIGQRLQAMQAMWVHELQATATKGME